MKWKFVSSLLLIKPGFTRSSAPRPEISFDAPLRDGIPTIDHLEFVTALSVTICYRTSE